MQTPPQKRRILLATFGSLGDLHPYLALAMELKARGHEPLVATHGVYREKIEALGISFHAVRPDAPNVVGLPEIMKDFMHLKKGPEMVLRNWIIPALRDSLEDTLAAANGADLLVSHPLTYAVRLAAELAGARWVSTALSPLSFLSSNDVPPLLPGSFFITATGLNRTLYRAVFPLIKRVLWSWHAPYRSLRKELGLPVEVNPIADGQHSPELALALFSELFGAPQVDWPPQARITGFPFFDQAQEKVMLPPDLARFLDAGPSPIVFTLGSSAVMTAERFYEHSAAAAARLGRRAVLLVGPDPRNRLSIPTTPEIACFDYAPYAELFPRAAAIVHQGGVGTTAQAMRAGKPMLVMPFAFDQPDNAARVVRLGIARTLTRGQYTPERCAKELWLLLENPQYAQRAGEVGVRIRSENGAKTACDALEALL